ncbi:MAG: hypothetical protein WDZ75_02000 [Candidatus Paceibacterota bacterium]
MNPVTTPYEVWQTVTVGRGFPKSEILFLLGHACEIDDQATMFLKRSRFWVSRVEGKVDFVLVPVRSLGLTRISYSAIVARARELGLYQCTVEAALNLRLQYCERQMQPGEPEMIPVAMKPISTKWQGRDRPSILCLAGGAASMNQRPELCVRHVHGKDEGGDLESDVQDGEVWAFVLPRMDY